MGALEDHVINFPLPLEPFRPTCSGGTGVRRRLARLTGDIL
jgi:hypothetical protein